MFRRLWILPIAVLSLLGSTAQPARADWLFTPYLGAAFGGDTPSEQITYGGSAAFLEPESSVSSSMLVLLRTSMATIRHRSATAT